MYHDGPEGGEEGGARDEVDADDDDAWSGNGYRGAVGGLRGYSEPDVVLNERRGSEVRTFIV